MSIPLIGSDEHRIHQATANLMRQLHDKNGETNSITISRTSAGKVIARCVVRTYLTAEDNSGPETAIPEFNVKPSRKH